MRVRVSSNTTLQIAFARHFGHTITGHTYRYSSLTNSRYERVILYTLVRFGVSIIVSAPASTICTMPCMYHLHYRRLWFISGWWGRKTRILRPGMFSSQSVVRLLTRPVFAPSPLPGLTSRARATPMSNKNARREPGEDEMAPSDERPSRKLWVGFLFYFSGRTILYLLTCRDSRALNPLVFWAAHGHKDSSHLPPVHALDFYLALGSALPQPLAAPRVLLTRAVALSTTEQEDNKDNASDTGVPKRISVAWGVLITS